ncbi:enoyl-CoA hydratase/isomerase family protein [Fictibacillus nanhaiensis]|uniref:enoyl-CoA hydratase/isomerase family protein n=1 Tax=Fictibacillus nanhaiensis TaxID=742169 RepID=UPI002E1EE9C2|nr:enoyl-CoA hydratase/isomerase family protein [Fictibacillus nanhaiensis]
MSEEVLFSVNSNGVATIILNRPKALNSLSHKMVLTIGEKLKKWKADDKVSVVILKGAGTKGLCAGGDIKTLYEARSSRTAMQEAERFFEDEYEVDMEIYLYPKPIIACLDGIVMGGGVGLTYGASHRIVTERTKWSMPEMNIGFFPDVGGAYFLNKAPGYIGRYLALTASVIKAPDVLYMKGADIYMNSETMCNFLEKVENMDWTDGEVEEKLNYLINKYEAQPSEESRLALLQKEIDEHFCFKTIEEILDSLESQENDFCRNTKEILLSKSPFSLKVTLQQLLEGKQKTMKECFATDLFLAKNFLRHNDFYEGIRSLLIDKDQLPNYEYKRVSDVTDEIVNTFCRSQTIIYNLSKTE